MSTPAILIFDVGKTNKKILLFDEQYKLLHEDSIKLDEIVDEDGFPCENLQRLTAWLKESMSFAMERKDVELKAVNFAGYGASLVHLDEKGNTLTPLYNYLKPYPEQLRKKFYDHHGDEHSLSKQTASPVLGSLNSGLQLYRLKYQQPEVYRQIKYSLHLPQYLSYVLCNQPSADISSVGCHTALWDFQKNGYHDWVIDEGIHEKLPHLYKGDHVLGEMDGIQIGIGLHDSSAALIPYLTFFHEPFVLISTGTWCISLNPFNHSPLTEAELDSDCLCYLSYLGQPVKASRLFAGHEHEQEEKKLAEHFNRGADSYIGLQYEPGLARQWLSSVKENAGMGEFSGYEEGYYHLVWRLVQQQKKATELVLDHAAVKRIFVDGGFARNQVYMGLLAEVFPGFEVFSAKLSQASALGAALAIHGSWNRQAFPAEIIELKYYMDTGINLSM